MCGLSQVDSSHPRSYRRYGSPSFTANLPGQRMADTVAGSAARSAALGSSMSAAVI